MPPHPELASNNEETNLKRKLKCRQIIMCDNRIAHNDATNNAVNIAVEKLGRDNNQTQMTKCNINEPH